MSREDPQFRIRLPVELKEKVEESAKINNRSLNAEIVHSLDMIFQEDVPADEILSAQDAFKIASKAKEGLSSVIFKRTFSEINSKVRIGHKTFNISLSDLELDGLSDDDYVSIFQPTFKRLEELGYEVPRDTWDSQGFLIVIP